MRADPVEDRNCFRMAGALAAVCIVAPHLEVGGWGNSGCRMTVSGNTILLAWKDRTYLAMGSNSGFIKASCGYVGVSDSWQDLKDNLKLDWEFDRAEDGNIALTGHIDIPKTPEFTVAIAFGNSRHAAITALFHSLSVPFSQHGKKYIEQWHRAGSAMVPLDSLSGDGGGLYRISHNLLSAHEDKTFAGATVLAWRAARRGRVPHHAFMAPMEDWRTGGF